MSIDGLELCGVAGGEIWLDRGEPKPGGAYVVSVASDVPESKPRKCDDEESDCCSVGTTI